MGVLVVHHILTDRPYILIVATVCDFFSQILFGDYYQLFFEKVSSNINGKAD